MKTKESMMESEQLFKCKSCSKEYKQWDSWNERVGFCHKRVDTMVYDETHPPIGVNKYKHACSNECFHKIFHKIIRQIREPNINICLSGCNIPPKYFNIVSDKTELVKKCSTLEKGVFLQGKVGTGKTVFVCSLAREIILNNNIRVEFVASPYLIMKIQDTFNDKSKDTSLDVLDEFSKAEVLIIDDLGSEKMSDFVRQSLYYVINYREQYLLKTIITSNYSLKQLSEYIDPRISSRIAGMCDVYNFSGDDRRLNK